MVERIGRKGFSLRLPPDLKLWLDARANKNGRSVNREIIQMIKTAKQAENDQA